MPFKTFRKGLPFTSLFIFLLIGVMSASNILASHHQGQIAYTSKRAGNHEIYVADPDGVNRIRLTHHAADDAHPSWSPDGGRIAFISNRNGGNYQIYVMDSNGKNLRRLTQGPRDWFPSWSPDGQTIAFEGFGAVEPYLKIHVVAPDGTNWRRLGTDISSSDRHPTWSPDSRRIAYESWRNGERADIYVMSAGGRHLSRLTFTDVSERQPAWSPSGEKIAFCSKGIEDPESSDFEIFVMDADGKNRKRLTDNKREDWHPAWSPDGNTIAFEHWRKVSLKSELHLMTANGVYLTPLSDSHRATDYAPDWFGPAGLSVSSVGSQPKIWGELKVFGAGLH